ncbi:hypothetical protein HK096_010396 [Nowakowskiella sp. JEL0078]|nr:hypothetical protein HK096_010396 [Nowakowskiella sp. JEL0078]
MYLDQKVCLEVLLQLLEQWDLDVEYQTSHQNIIDYRQQKLEQWKKSQGKKKEEDSQLSKRRKSDINENAKFDEEFVFHRGINPTVSAFMYINPLVDRFENELNVLEDSDLLSRIAAAGARVDRKGINSSLLDVRFAATTCLAELNGVLISNDELSQNLKESSFLPPPFHSHPLWEKYVIGDTTKLSRFMKIMVAVNFVMAQPENRLRYNDVTIFITDQIKPRQLKLWDDGLSTVYDGFIAPAAE